MGCSCVHKLSFTTDLAGLNGAPWDRTVRGITTMVGHPDKWASCNKNHKSRDHIPQKSGLGQKRDAKLCPYSGSRTFATNGAILRLAVPTLVVEFPMPVIEHDLQHSPPNDEIENKTSMNKDAKRSKMPRYAMFCCMPVLQAAHPTNLT